MPLGTLPLIHRPLGIGVHRPFVGDVPLVLPVKLPGLVGPAVPDGVVALVAGESGLLWGDGRGHGAVGEGQLLEELEGLHRRRRVHDCFILLLVDIELLAKAPQRGQLRRPRAGHPVGAAENVLLRVAGFLGQVTVVVVGPVAGATPVPA